MRHFDEGHQGHFERAFPQLTTGIKILLAINVAGFLLKNIICDLVLNTDLVPLIGLSAANLFDGLGLGLLRLVTYQFFHGIMITHLLFNMLFLYFFGTLAEGRRDEGFDASYLRRGRAGIIRLYIASGICGGVIYALLSKALGGSGMPVIGASGAVYGIMVYAACMFPRMKINMVFVQPEMRYFVGVLVFIGIYYQLFEIRGAMRVGGGGVAHSAHIGGALWGFIAYKLAKSGKFTNAGPLAWLKRKREEGAARVQHNRNETMNRLLDKIKAQGINSLTPAERRFLEKMSKNVRK